MPIDIIHPMNGVKGYVIYSIRRKLKKQYAHLKGSQIMKLKQSGTEVSCEVL
jgi:ribonuclease Z